MKTKFTSLILIITCLTVFVPQVVGRTGYYPNTIEDVLKLDDEKIDIATSVLLVSKRWGNGVNIDSYLNRIDEMAEQVLKTVGPSASNRKTIEAINSLLFKKMGFKPVDNADNPDDLFLNTVIDNKRGYCLSLSILYLSIGERLDLPLYGVVVPGHFFVRCDDKNSSFNIETTQQGVSPPDKHYIDEFKIPDRTDGIYLRNLTKKETIGCLFNNLANIYYNNDQIEIAFYYQRLAVALTPMLAEARTNLGNIYLKKNMPDSAIEQYEKALRINSADAKTNHNLANAYRKKGLMDAAIKHYNIAIELDPNYIEIYKGLAQVYHSKGLDIKAIAVLKNAIDVNSRDPEIYTTLAGIYHDLGQLDSAISNYSIALSLKNDSVEAACGLGYAYFQKERYYDAIEHFRTAVYYNPLHARSHLGLGLVYNKLGWPEDEIQAYQNAIKADPNMVAAYQNLAGVYMGRKDYELAIENYKSAIKLSPQDADIYFNMGVAYSELKQYDDAKRCYLKTIEFRWNFPAAHNNLAITLYTLGRYQQSLNHAKIAQQQGFAVSQDLLNQLNKIVTENKP
jgi:tetratricopeptide (TPR) repeat protein